MAPEVTISLLSFGAFSSTRTALELAGLGPRLSSIEILWDNYCAADPVQLADDLASFADRTLIHIMWSRFLDLDDSAFDEYLTHLGAHVRVLRPIAVSDHLCRFCFDGYFVGAAQEHTYDRIEHVASRIARYQDAIGMQLLIENNASLEYPATTQSEFLHAVMERTGCGIMFDISNAVVGELNGRGAVTSWLPLLAGRDVRCHVGSYYWDDQVDRAIDSHDREVSEATRAAIRAVHAAATIQSITYERDANRDSASIAADLRDIRASLCL
jgi:uncharacterized protein (UPF0276 family)